MRPNKNVFPIIIIVIYLLCYSTPKVIAQDQLLKKTDEIINVYKNQGKEGLIKYAQINKDILREEYINIFIKTGIELRSQFAMNISLILAIEKQDEEYLAYVLRNHGVYYNSIGNYNKALEYYLQALELYKKANYIKKQISYMEEVQNIIR